MSRGTTDVMTDGSKLVGVGTLKEQVETTLTARTFPLNVNTQLDQHPGPVEKAHPKASG